MRARMDNSVVRSFSAGLSQKGVRNHNERLLLSLLQRHGQMPGGDLAKLAGLSPPAVSAILKRLELDGLLVRGEPTRGKVGKPSVPMMLAPGGVLSIGLKIGRRSADLLLMDFKGTIRTQRQFKYAYPVPADVFAFLAACMSEILASLSPAEVGRICGIGVAAPFEMWNWHDLTGDDADVFMRWKDINIPCEIAKFNALPVSIVNDATAACHAEHIFGRGKEFRDYAYFFVGAFVGGGIVLNHSVYEGRKGNAGALGSLRSISPLGESKQLIDMASIHLLETRLSEVDIAPERIWRHPQDWSGIARYVDPWLGQTAQELAKASLSICAVIDFEAIIIDGAFPNDVRSELVERVRRYIVNQDTRGLIAPRIEAGSIGGNARAIGAACGPILSQYLLNTNAGVAVA
ncbi:MarR family transcriptional regulator [Yoonia sediminilitoris]|uniref:MarR family transcriptional regulator n=2 Tax=Yoonia sediminilitoris TaxID=1286148 RepID=A0A2T6KMB4_9RHOB|nr:MarR family transcriptional regulator [Yoonia sediminilitoris]RCW97641.1 MarR family transcriptional regulator [Yoonia sediminilitoris]